MSTAPQLLEDENTRKPAMTPRLAKDNKSPDSWESYVTKTRSFESDINKANQEGPSMEAVALLAILEARPGKEAELEAFLKTAQPLAENETETVRWYAFKIGSAKFGIFDTFANEAGRDAHLTGEIAKSLTARAGELLAVPPQIEKAGILAKTPLNG
jgi:quinol monooxygenase YgiN